MVPASREGEKPADSYNERGNGAAAAAEKKMRGKDDSGSSSNFFSFSVL